jgi:hypothetical protein
MIAGYRLVRVQDLANHASRQEAAAQLLLVDAIC